MNPPLPLNLTPAWLGIFLGLASGTVLGLFFHRENWLGGYASFKRQMHRLAHLSFFGLGAGSRIIRDRVWELCARCDINFIPRNMTAGESQAGFLKLARHLYSAEETQTRRRRFKRMPRTSPNFGPRASRPQRLLERLPAA